MPKTGIGARKFVSDRDVAIGNSLVFFVESLNMPSVHYRLWGNLMSNVASGSICAALNHGDLSLGSDW